MAASAGYLPERVVTNDELSKIMDTSDEWIQAHTGIKTRKRALNDIFHNHNIAIPATTEIIITDKIIRRNIFF